MNRRAFLRTLGLGAIAAGPLIYALRTLDRETLAPPAAVDRDPTAYAIRRLTYGVTPALYRTARSMGVSAFVEQQLQPDPPPDNALAERLKPFQSYLTGNGAVVQKTLEKPVAMMMNALVSTTTLRALYTERQLFEQFVQFFTNHFYVSLNKAMVYVYVFDYDRDAIRPNAFSTFRQLLGASAHSPAMLTFLDNRSNYRNHTNENYAREVMELHTIGVGSFTETDVKEVTRCFTGWTWSSAESPAGGVSFEFADRRHDASAKTVLGTAIPAGGGERDGEIVLDLLASHPATARHISTKLARRYVSENPPAALVDQLAATFQATGGSIHDVVRALFTAGEFWNAPPKFKQPFEYVISVLRALNYEIVEMYPFMRRITQSLNAMGQFPLSWATPSGFPDAESVWVNSLLERWNFALAAAAAAGDLDGAHPNLQPLFDLMDAEGVDTALEPMLDFMSRYLLGRSLTPAEQPVVYAFARAAADLPTQFSAGIALLLASPAFQYR